MSFKVEKVIEIDGANEITRREQHKELMEIQHAFEDWSKQANFGSEITGNAEKLGITVTIKKVSLRSVNNPLKPCLTFDYYSQHILQSDKNKQNVFELPEGATRTFNCLRRDFPKSDLLSQMNQDEYQKLIYEEIRSGDVAFQFTLTALHKKNI